MHCRKRFLGRGRTAGQGARCARANGDITRAQEPPDWERRGVTFGTYLRELRKSRRLTLRQLALYSGVSQSYLSQIERGRRGRPSAEVATRLAGVLKVPVTDLLVAAGYLAPGTTGDPLLEAFYRATAEMSPREREAVREELLAYLAVKEESARRRSRRGPGNG